MKNLFEKCTYEKWKITNIKIITKKTMINDELLMINDE